MNRLVPAAFAPFLNLFLVCGLLFSPLAHPLTPASAQPAQQESAMPCHTHPDAADADPGGCCCKPGSACHCAMAVAIPAAALTVWTPAPTAYFAMGRILHPYLCPPPETPPPRA